MKYKIKLTHLFILILFISSGCSKLLEVNDNSEKEAQPVFDINKVATPSFNPLSGFEFVSSQNITITCLTAGALIYYTTNGDTPNDTTGTLYTGPFTITTNTGVKAIAYKDGMTKSDIATANYTKAGNVANPSFLPSDGTIFTGTQEIIITTITEGATIRFTTDGSDPSPINGTIYSSPFFVIDTTTIKAIAYKTGNGDSAITAITVTSRVLSPVFNPVSGSNFNSTQIVAISTATSGATIRYTTDGTDPNQIVGIEYTAPFSISDTTTIKAIAYKTGMADSIISSAIFTKLNLCITPVITPSTGSTFTAPFAINIATATSGASIKFTTDGSDPKTSSTAVTVSSDNYTLPYMAKNIKVYAYKTGYSDSAISEATYTINIAPFMTASVLKTGQTTSYGPGDDGDLEKGEAEPIPRFVDNGDGTITDNLTGLMWIKEPHSATSGNTTMKTWANALDYCNNLNFAGHTDWRLPNIKELQSIINYEEANQSAYLIAKGFVGIKSGSYWTSTTNPLLTNRAFYLRTSDGIFMNNNDKTSSSYVLAVRGNSAKIAKTGQNISYGSGDDGDLQKGVSWPNPRFTDNGNGTITDNLTGLVWVKRGVERTVTSNFTNALNYCNNLDFAGKTDWRLPNKNEIESLVNFGVTNTGIWLNTNGFINVKTELTTYYYWTSTTYKSSTTNVFSVHFDYCFLYFVSKTVSGGSYALVVSDGP